MSDPCLGLTPNMAAKFKALGLDIIARPKDFGFSVVPRPKQTTNK
jgi:hypothetical protein